MPKQNDTIALYAERLKKSQISIVSGWLSRIKALLDEVEDIAEFYDRLPEIYPELDSGKFAKNINDAVVASSLAGVYEASLNEFPVEFAETDKAEYQTVPFREAIDFFNAKGNLGSDKWDDLKDGEHDSYFVSAGAKGALLQDLRTEVEKSIISGQDREQFKAAFNEIVDRRGWNVKGGNDWRAGIIYQTNLRQAYGDGRCRQMSDPDVVSKRPYRMWVHGNSAEPRPTHIAMNGRVFRSDDVVANQRLPMGFGCRCTWVTLSDRDLKRRGLQVTSGLNWGDIVQTAKGDQPLEIDKGFVNPCKFESENEREGRKSKARQEILDRMPEDIRRDAIREIAALVFGLATVTSIVGISLVPVPSGIIATATKDLSKSDRNGLYVLGGALAVGGASTIPVTVGSSEGLKTIPLGLYLPSIVPTEVSKAVRSNYHEEIAKQVKSEIRASAIQELIDNLADPDNDNSLTFVIGGGGDKQGNWAVYLANRLEKQGLTGQVIPILNPIESLAKAEGIPADLVRSLAELVKMPLGGSSDKQAIDLIAKTIDRSLTIYQQSLAMMPDSVKVVIAMALRNRAGRINFVTHSAGSAIGEDIAGVLAAMGINVNNVVTLGGITTPPKLSDKTNYRRYISDADKYQILNKLPRTGKDDRFYKDIFHGNEEDKLELGNRFIVKTWLGNKKVLGDVVADLNPPMPKVPLGLPQPQIPLEKLPEVTKPVEAKNQLKATPVEAKEVIKQIDKAEPKPKIVAKPIETRLITPEELQGLREAAKRDLDFTIRINKNKDGRFNVQPTKKDGYQWTAEKAQKVADFLERNGIPLKDFEANNPAWQEGMNYLKVESRPDLPISTQPVGNLAPAIPNMFATQAMQLERAAKSTRAKLSSLEVEKTVILDRLSNRIEEDNPLYKDVQARYNRQIGLVKKQLDQQDRRARALALDAEKLDRLPNTPENKIIGDAINDRGLALLRLDRVKELEQDIKLVQGLIASIQPDIAKAVGKDKTVLNRTLKQYQERLKTLEGFVNETDKAELVKEIRRLETIIKRGLNG